MDTLFSARKSIWAPISHDFRNFFISVWLRWYPSVHRKLSLWCLKRDQVLSWWGCSLKQKRIGTKLQFLVWNRASDLRSIQATTKGFWKSALFETPELKVAPSQNAHLTADSARLGANSVTNVTHFCALPSFGCKRITLLFMPLMIQDFPDWILASRSRACNESNVCLREIPTLENFLEESLYHIGYLSGQLLCFSFLDCFEFPKHAIPLYLYLTRVIFPMDRNQVTL